MACVYILTNPSIPGLVKIGHTAGAAADRAAQISQGTGVPTAYQVAWYCETTTAEAAARLEREVHQHCAANRVNRAREFFNLAVEQAAAVIESIGYRNSAIAITSPEVAARAQAEQARIRAEAAAEAERLRALLEARAEQRRVEQERIRAEQERAASLARSEQARAERAARAENEKAALWLWGIGALLLLTPLWGLSLFLFFFGWAIHPN